MRVHGALSRRRCLAARDATGSKQYADFDAETSGHARFSPASAQLQLQQGAGSLSRGYWVGHERIIKGQRSCAAIAMMIIRVRNGKTYLPTYKASTWGADSK